MIDKKISHKRTNCRLCLSEDIELVIEMGKSPISEKYVVQKELSTVIPKVSINLYYCKNCKHIQMLDVVNPDYLWSNFTFKTSRDEKLINHFDKYAKEVLEFEQMDKESLILDIGSNDGTMLNSFKKLGFENILGIDPAEEIVKEANARGVKTIQGYFNKQTAKDILTKYGKPKVIIANNVFAHVDDLREMLQSIKSIMDEKTIYVFEVSYLLDVIKKMLIGTIFHEHLCYHSIISLSSFFESFGLKLTKVKRGPEQGGSIICYSALKEKISKTHESVQELINLEKEQKLDQIETYKKFNKTLFSLKSDLIENIKKINTQGGKISGFGAARAGTTFLSYFEIGKYISKLYDDNEYKHFKYSPGDQIQVLPTNKILNDMPDYLVIFAWIHADKIIEDYKDYLDKGGAFIKFYPKLEIIKKNI